MQNIREFLLKCKPTLDRMLHEWGMPLVVLFLGLASFVLGRLSTLEASRPMVSVYQLPASGAASALPLGGEYVGARTGSVYYFPWCAGALKIKPGNQVWFKDETEAKKAGYAPAKNCKGL